VDDLFLMSVLDRLEHLQEKRQALGNPKPMCLAPARQRLALQVLHRQVGQPVRIHPSVVQTCDVGMLETGQDVALTRKALLQP
jgi:hypothetical protein